MSLYNQFAESHTVSPDKPFLWAMRLSTKEYYQLKEYIKANVFQGRFNCVRKESALFYAEWWRREFTGGHPKKEQVCKCVFGNEDWKEQFFRAAQDGAQSLGLQIIRTKGEQREMENSMYSILYQGGLPMHFIVNEIQNRGARNNWNSFFKKLAWDELDYESIPGNKIASLSNSIRSFCDELRCAESIWDAPFYVDCLSWWKIVEHDFEEEIKNYRSRNPFSFKWLIELNENLLNACISFSVTGPQKIPQEFANQRGLQQTSPIFLSAHINGTPFTLAEYDPEDGTFYSRRVIDRTFRYSLGDDIELYLSKDQAGSILLERHSLDFSAPTILILTDRVKNIHTVGDINKLSTVDCVIACTEDWRCENLDSMVYHVGNSRIKLFKTRPANIPVVLSSETGEIKTLDPNIPLSKTAMDESRVLSLPVATKERLFNAPDNVSFYEVRVNHNGQDQNNERGGRNVLYASKGSREWNGMPKMGLIRARIIREDNEFVDPIQFYNVGLLSVKCIESSRDACDLQIEWPHGKVYCESAEETGNNVWHIERTRLEDPRYVPFSFHPPRGEAFTIHFLVPYFGFQIYDYNGKEVGNRATIPISDLDGFRYYIHPIQSITITPSARGFRDQKKYVYHDSEDGKNTLVTERIADLAPRRNLIPIEGPLSSLFMDGYEQIAELVDKQTEPLPDASVIVPVEVSGGASWSFQLKDFPYRLDGDETSVLLRYPRTMPEYPGELLALPFDRPESVPVPLQRAEENPTRFLITEAILSSESRVWLIFGNIKGYVLPWALVLKNEQADDSQRQSRSEILSDLKRDLAESALFSPVWMRTLSWFDNIQRWTIPGSSVLELVAVADDWDLLCKFALHLYLRHCKSEDELDNLKNTLADFQRQLYFIWAWARVSETTTTRWLEDAWDEVTEFIKPFYITWVTKEHYDDLVTYLTDENLMVECRESLVEKFIEWMDELERFTTPKIKYRYADLNQNGGDSSLSTEANQLFSSIQEEMNKHLTGMANMTPNELWKMERRFLSYKLSTVMNLGDLGEDETIKTEIKKTTIFGLKFNPGHEV